MIARRDVLLLAALTVAAAALRLWGADHGLPYTYHPDEHQYVDTALAVLGGELNPGRFNNPSLVKYALGGVDTIWLAVGRAGGVYASRADFLARAAADPSAAYLLARAVIGIVGALTVLLTYALGRAAYGRGAGLVAAALLAGAYLHVRESHFAVSDVPATALSTAALLGAVRVLTAARRRDYVLTGLLIGLAAAAKYSGGLVVVAFLAAHLLAERAGRRDWARRLRDRRLLVAGAAAVLAFLLTVPFAVLDWPAFRADVSLLLARGQSGFKGLRLAEDVGWLFYLDTLAWGLGPLLLAAVLAGVGWAAGRHRRIDVVLLAFPLVLYLYLGRQLLLFERFILPALPALLVVAAGMLVAVVDRSPVRVRWRPAVVGTLTALALARPVADSLRCDWLLTRTDTRTLAKQWIESNIPVGTKLLVHSNGPELAGAASRPPASRRVYDLTVMGTTGLVDEPLEHYRSAGYAYLVLSSFSYERRLLDPAADAAHRAYYSALEAEVPLVEEFVPYRGEPPPPFLYARLYGPATDLWRFERPGPVVRIYRLTPDG